MIKTRHESLMLRRASLFTTLLLLSCLVGLTAMADPGDMRSAEPEQTGRGRLAAAPSPALRKTAKSASANLQTIEGYSITPFAQRAGAITALAAHEQILFGLDSRRERIMRFSDRRASGKSGQSSIFISGLHSPSDLQVHDSHLYYTDAVGLWRVPIGRGLSPSEPPIRMIDLSNVNAKMTPRPFTLINDGQTALIGFSASQDLSPHSRSHAPNAGQAIVTVDLDSGKSDIFVQGLGDILALEATPSGHIIAITQEAGDAQSQMRIFTPEGVQSAQTALEPSGGPSGILLTPNRSWGDMLIAFRGAPEDGRGGYHVSAITFALGVPNPQYHVIIDGFTAKTRRSAWGRPTALSHFGSDSVIIADDWSETLWRLSALPEAPQEEPARATPEDTDPKDSEKPTTEEAVEAQASDTEASREEDDSDKPTRIRIGGKRPQRN